jgi:primosomal protein N'
VKFSAEHLKKEIEAKVQSPKSKVAPNDATLDFGPGTLDLMISGPAPAPLARAENFYRYQLMLRTRTMSRLSQALAKITAKLSLPDDVTLAVDIDPVDLS